MVRFFFMMIVVSALGVAGYLNQEQEITLHFFGGMETHAIKVYLIASSTFLVGFIFSGLLFCPGWIRAKLDRRKQSKRIEQLEIDIDRIRSSAIKEPKVASAEVIMEKEE